MKPSGASFMVRGALRAFLPAAGVLSTAAVAIASGGGEAAHGSAAIPWGEIVKQAINFGILVGVLVYFLRKPVASFLKERSELMRKSIDDAANARAEAVRKLEAVDARMAKLSDEVAAMNAKMDAEAALEAQALRDTVAAEIARIKKQAEFTGEQEVKKARAELQQEASLLSAKAAEELVRKSLSPEDQDRLVKENIQKIEGILR
ncbi:MAG: ATP synthase F0 subunit B [Deltaproteobacteria bacterium]|nr:ATP synthase F0 subunit B [Deltaproteobacteria bacterium]